LAAILQAAMEERKKIDKDETKVKSNLVSCFLSKLKKKNKAASVAFIKL
jgi:hypothetical protein